MTTSLMPLIPFDRRSAAPYYKQIYDGFRSAILAGRLRPGQRLPSTRGLATELDISRLPVVNAFEQLLHEGYIEGRTGSGTYVTESIPEELSLAPREKRRVGTVPGPRAVDLSPFRVSLPALDRFPHKIWSRIVARQARRLTVEVMAYGDPEGYFPLREAIADYLRTARAVRCDASQVMIVSGSQMALQICASTLLERGGAVGMEEPGYPGARDVLLRRGANIVPIAVDADGIDVAAIAASRKSIGAVYVTPSHQYPLGVSMNASRRLALLEWAKRASAWIIEDDYDSEFRYASRPLGSLQGSDTASRVIYIGTFSKVMYPALRVGYMVVPPALREAFARAREALDIFPAILEQLALHEFVREGNFARHLRRMRALYARRCAALVRALREHAGLQPYNSEAGLHLSVFLPRGVDDRRIAQQAIERGVHATPLSSCYAGRGRSGLILGFGSADERKITAAARKLGEVLGRRP